MKPIIYKTTKPTKPMNGDERFMSNWDWNKILVQFVERDGEILAEANYVSKFGNLTTILNRRVAGKTLDSCKAATNRMLNRVYGCKLDGVLLENANLQDMHASFTDEQVHERFKAWAASLFE